MKFILCCFTAICIKLLLLSPSPVQNPELSEGQLERTIVLLFEDVLFLYSLLRFVRCMYSHEPIRRDSVFAFISLNPSLVLLGSLFSHHESLLLGLLLFSLSLFSEGKHIIGSALFALSLGLNSRFVTALIPIFVFVCRSFLFAPKTKETVFTKRNNEWQIPAIWPKRLLALTITVTSIFLLSNLVPELIGKGGKQFDFENQMFLSIKKPENGSSFEPPNFWAIYSILDKILRVREDTPVLPIPIPLASIILTAIFILPSICRLWKNPTAFQLILSVSQCTLTWFLFGFCIKPSSIMISLITLLLLSGKTKQLGRLSFLLSTVGNFCVMKMVTTPMEIPLKWSFLTAFTLMHSLILMLIHTEIPTKINALGLPRIAKTWKGLGVSASSIETLYVVCLVFVEILCTFLSNSYAFIQIGSNVFHTIGLLYLWFLIAFSMIPDSINQ